MQLVFDVLLMPVNPTMLQARDAALSADPDAVRRSEPEGAWLEVRTGQHGRQRFRDE